MKIYFLTSRFIWYFSLKVNKTRTFRNYTRPHYTNAGNDLWAFANPVTARTINKYL